MGGRPGERAWAKEQALQVGMVPAQGARETPGVVLPIRASGVSSGTGCSSDAAAVAAGAPAAAAGSTVSAAAAGSASAAGAVSPDGLSPASSDSPRSQTTLLLPPHEAATDAAGTMLPNPKPRCAAATASLCSDLLCIIKKK